MSKLELERWKSAGEADPVGKYEVRVTRERSTKGRERYRVKCVRGKPKAAHPDWANDALTMRASKTESRMLDMPPNFSLG